MKKRFLSVLLGILLVLSLFNRAASAKEPSNDSRTNPLQKPSIGGALQLLRKDGQMTLCNAKGEPIQLRGMSTHGLQWFPGILNNNAFAALANDWGSNAIRLALYVGESGYATDPSLMQKIIDGINLAIKNDLYVIIDWHVLTPGDPNAPIYKDAMAFFKEIAGLYPNDHHLIYELANEPNSGDPGVTNDAKGWERVKSYAEPIIKMLRDNGNKNLVLVGSPNWSQRPDLAADNPIKDDNTIYTVHFYTGTHKSAADSMDRANVMSNVRYALEHGVAVFASEWGTSEASGNNGPFLKEADEWLDYLDANNISWCNWSLSNKNETSAAFQPFELGKQDATSLNPDKDQKWSLEELSLSGEYARSRILGIPYDPIDRTPRTVFSDAVWDFDDGSLQGFGINGDSPIQSVTLTNVNKALSISGLETSRDISEGNYWVNVRLSADQSTARPDIFGAEALSMDVILTAPDTVAIAAIPQSTTHGWANPLRAVTVKAEDFTLQSDGTYKAKLTITPADSPNFDAISKDNADSTMTNVVLFVGTEKSNEIRIDNITVSGNKVIAEIPIVHDPQGKASLPSDFKDGTRQGWAWDPGSGVKTAMTIKEINGSKALTFEAAYPEVKPTDGWASAPRMILSGVNTTRQASNRLSFDLYLKPVKGNTGTLSVNLAFAPPSLGYWAQTAINYDIDLTKISKADKTKDGYYHYTVTFDLTKITDNKVIAPDTLLRDITIVIADVQSNFAGTISIDNIRFEKAKKADSVKETKNTKTPAVKETKETKASSVYVVKPGDSLWNIAKKYNMTYQELARRNNIKNPALIYPAQKLILP